MKRILAISMSSILVLSALIAMSSMSGTAQGRLNCDGDDCTGGSGSAGGGGGGHCVTNEAEDTRTCSGGHGSVLSPGGAGGRGVCSPADEDRCENVGGGK